MDEQQIKKPWSRYYFVAMLIWSFAMGGILFVSMTPRINWSYLGEGDEKIEMTLVRCRECPEDKEWWSFECFYQDFDHHDWDDAAEVFKDGEMAGKAFLAMELIALFFTAALQERLLSYLCKRDYGNPYVLYILPFLIFLFHFLALTSWFGESGANWENNWDDLPKDDSDEAILCAADGPILILVNLFFIFIFSLFLVWVFCNRDSEYDAGRHGLENGTLCYMSTRQWLIVISFLLFLNFVLVTGAWVTPKWVERTADDLSFTGGIFHCHDCNESFEVVVGDKNVDSFYTVSHFVNKNDISNFGWDCLQGEMPCDDKEDDYGYCDVFEKLWIAGTAYSFCQVLVVMSLLMMLNTVIHGICGREYGIPFINYLNSFALFLFQLLSVVFWFSISDATLDGDWDSDVDALASTERPKICATHGPAVAIAETLVAFPTVVLFWVVYWRRGKILNATADSRNDSSIEISINI